MENLSWDRREVVQCASQTPCQAEKEDCSLTLRVHFSFFLSSRNLLSTLPKYLFDLPLKVLVVSNNKLVSIPEEIGKLRDLMELVSTLVNYCTK